jgi:hypothetical protein
MKALKPNWSKFKKWLSFRQKELVSIIDFIFLFVERTIVISGLILLVLWGYKIFIVCEPETIRKAKVFISFCNVNWKGLLIFLPFIFYRIIIDKIKELSEFYSMKFRNKTAEPVGQGTINNVEEI